MKWTKIPYEIRCHRDNIPIKLSVCESCEFFIDSEDVADSGVDMSQAIACMYIKGGGNPPEYPKKG